jgi:hypothetical protein
VSQLIIDLANLELLRLLVMQQLRAATNKNSKLLKHPKIREFKFCKKISKQGRAKTCLKQRKLQYL